MKLSIVIPALNEEESIASIIERSLAAEETLKNKSGITSIEVIVVSDGSTDKTVEIASTYLPKIKLIIFEKNKGYGAAIKQGWSEASGDLLAFIDADGTCDPLFFSNLANLIEKNNADVVLGCRLNENSEMPLIRKIGNFIFATMLTFLSSKYVKDTASGMRIVRKTSLKKLYPLPDGLHFTPAMSAKSLLSDEIVISEENMPYKEREGESKLHVAKDGIRFLKVILSTTFLYRPQIIFNSFSFIFAILACLLMGKPILHYLNNKNVEDWMIYRFVVSDVLGIISLLLFSSSYILQKSSALSLSSNIKDHVFKGIAIIFFNSYFSIIVAIGSLVIGFALVWDSFVSRVLSGVTNEHWSRYIGFSFFIVAGTIILLTKISNGILTLIKNRILFIQSEEYKNL